MAQQQINPGIEPQRNAEGYYNVGERMKGARTDDELVQAVVHRQNDVVLVQYGASWCQKCKALLPTFLDLSGKFDKMDYVVASVENMQEAVQGIRHTPHFRVFREGKRVDEFYGANAQQLRDRMWLHHER